MHVLVICRFDKDPIKNEGPIVFPEIEPVHAICKTEEDLSKNEGAVVLTLSPL